MLLTETQERLRDAAREFIRAEVTPNAAKWERERAYPREIYRKLGKVGLLSVMIPTEWGGVGADYVSYALTIMEMAAGDPALVLSVGGQNTVIGMALVEYGTQAQRERYLPRTVAGELLGAFALTEPHAGSDASDLRVRATRLPGGGWRINGVKQFITIGSSADFVIVFARTDPNAGKKGLSAFILPTSTPGYRVVKVENKMGLNASDTCEIAFDDVEVPDDALFGAEGQGYKIALYNLEGGRVGIGSQCVGTAQAALDLAVAYAKERVTFGKPIAEHQAVACRLGDMACRVESARQMVLHAAALKAAGRPCFVEASMAKLFASEIAESVCSDALVTMGGNGYMADYQVERYYRAAIAAKIYEGTNDIQKLAISRAYTGLSAF